MLLSQFMKTHRITNNEYHDDMNTFDQDISQWVKILGKRHMYDIDTYPYLYILKKVKQKNDTVLGNFALFFAVILQRNGVLDNIIHPNIDDILHACSDGNDMFLFVYLIAAIQYYFL